MTRFRWPVTVASGIAASAGDVWSAISMPANLEVCHPFCDRNPVHEWPGDESRDEIHYRSGLVLTRRFSRWIDGVGYDLDIYRRQEQTASVSWRIQPGTGTRCRLQISVRPHLLLHLPVPVRVFPHVAVVRPRMRSYLASVVGGFKWFVETGDPVAPNQFGHHPWFS